MKLESIDGKKLYFAIISGANEVIQNKNILNKINVFPIADGDTGTNLAETMKSIIRKSNYYDSPIKTLESISDAALLGARGNSGTIFAQYINGITMELSSDRLDTLNFSTSVKNAVTHAYNSISNPVEGTMITVIRDWAESVYRYSKKAKDFLEILPNSLKDANNSLLDTPNKLEILKNNSVVDSGAKGFIYFINGFTNSLKEDTTPTSFIETNEDNLDLESTHHHNDLTYRYCTEALIEGDNIKLNDIKSDLSSYGDSTIIAGNNKKAKIHIHTDKPQDVFFTLRKYGRPIDQKVDDMKIQNYVVNNRKHNIALVTDSIADIPKDLLEKYQIHVIPLNVLIDESNYLDRLTIDSDSFHKISDNLKVYPTSSQPSVKYVEKLFSFLTTYYDSIISITVSDKLSGTFNSVKLASEKFKDKVSVINSKLNSGAQGLLVLKAAEEIANNKSHQEIVDSINKTIPKSHIYVNVDSIKQMIRSGRLSPIKGLLAKTINLKPIVSLDKDGNGVAFGKSFSSKGSTKKIISIIKDLIKENSIEKYSIVHSKGYEKALEYKEIFTDIIGKEPEYITDVSTIVAMSAGKNSVAISFITK